MAQVLLHEPDVLIMDEPTSGLDPNQIREVRTLIRELGENKTMLLSTHILQEVEAVADRVVLINDGSVVFDGLPVGDGARGIGRPLLGRAPATPTHDGAVAMRSRRRIIPPFSGASFSATSAIPPAMSSSRCSSF